MAFEVTVSEKSAGGRSGPVYELADTARTVRAEVWPAWGFNCLRWQARQPDGSWAGILYTAPDWETNPVPTRSGHPILFPFPGRLRHGRFEFEGKSYQLPPNDSTKQHTIHGFTPRNPWRVLNSYTDSQSASVTGEFNLRQDLPQALDQWPADFRLRVTYTLTLHRLQVDTTIENVGSVRMPFGLGYHPYFRLPGVADADISGHELQANVEEIWETDSENLPTGARKNVAGELDFRTPRALGAVALDHVFTRVTPSASHNPMIELAVLWHRAATGQLRILADTRFRELVLFTPPHRQAIAIEPYTCSADAANLQTRGIDSGWRTLAPGQSCRAAVEYRFEVH